MIEEIIFSQLMSNAEYARVVLPHLKEEYFNTQDEKNFFKIYKRFFSKHNKIPSRQALLIEIEKLKSSAEVYSAMVDIVGRSVEFDETLEYLVEQTEEFCKEKAIFNALKEAVLIADGQSKTKLPASIPSILQEALSVCFDTSVGHDYINDAMSRYDYYHSVTARITTGIPMIDKVTRNGFPRKTLNVFLAPPHGGKSLVMVNCAVGGMKAGHNVLYISMEMAAEEIGKRFDVNLLDIDFDTLEVIPKSTFTSQFKKLTDKSLGRLVIKEYPTGTASAAHIKSLLNELKTKQNFVPDIIVVDYMNICASEYYKQGSNHNSYTIVGSIGKELRALAIETNTCLITATQTNRSGINNSGVGMESVSESGGIAMIADFMMAIINTDDLKQLRQLMFKQIKNRYNGITDYEKFLVGVDYNKMKLFSLETTGTPVTVSKDKKKKTEPLNTDSGFNIDMLHTIKPKTNSFDDFNFNE